MTKLELIIIKTRNLFNELSKKEQHELIRSITADKIEEYLPKKNGSHYGNHGRLYALTDSKRQKLLIQFFMDADYSSAINTNAKHMRHLDTAVFKVMFVIIQQHLRYNTMVIEKYPEYFI